MKAIFAVSALAAAISAQAIAADTEATTTFTGEVNVGSVMDLLAEDRYHEITTEGDDGYFLDMNVAVKNGGFEGAIAFESDDNGDIAASIGDLTYTEGAIMFGDIDSIVTTSASVDEMAESTDYAVEKGFRYTNDDLGIKLQAERGDTNLDTDADGDVDDDDAEGGEGETDFGLAAAYMGDYDVATVHADLQYRESQLTGENDGNTPLYAGLKVVATPVEMLTVTAGYTTGHSIANDGTFYDTSVNSYGVRADVAVVEGVTAFGYYSQIDDADAQMMVGAAAEYSPVLVEVEYDIDAESVWGKVSLSEEVEVSAGLMVGAYAEAEYVTDADITWVAGANTSYAITEMLKASASFDVDSDSESLLKAGLAYTTEGGAALTADYENESEAWDEGESHKITAKASYSF